MLDLSKAFDTVNHSILINKLEKYGVRGNTNKLMNSYLSNRKQIVNTNNCNNAYSGELNLLCGVPQRSIFGPLLFSLYITDLPKASKFMTRLFADGTALILSDSNIYSLNERLNSEFAKIEQWLISNKLSLDLSKTKFLLISADKPIKPEKFNISIRGCNIERCQSIEYLQ